MKQCTSCGGTFDVASANTRTPIGSEEGYWEIHCPACFRWLDSDSFADVPSNPVAVMLASVRRASPLLDDAAMGAAFDDELRGRRARMED